MQMGMEQLIEPGREKHQKGITIWKYYGVAVLHFPDCEPLSHFCVILELQAMKGS